MPSGAQAQLISYPDGTLLRETTRPEVYVIEGGARVWVPDAGNLQRLYDGWANVKVVLGHESQRTLGDGGRVGSISYRACCNPVGARIIMRLEVSRPTR